MHPTLVRPTVAAWFEIPADDFDRAVAFYETIFEGTLRRERFGNDTLGVFPYEPPGVSGAVIDSPGNAGPSGKRVYLNADGRLDAILARVSAAGGTIFAPKTSLGEIGSVAVIVDTEGNRVGLHAIS